MAYPINKLENDATDKMMVLTVTGTHGLRQGAMVRTKKPNQNAAFREDLPRDPQTETGINDTAATVPGEG